MDFDEEMSSLQIEDLGEYFFPNELNNDNWKGFSLGYVEEDKSSVATSTTTNTSTAMASAVSKPITITRTSRHLNAASRDLSGSLSNSLGGGGISLGGMLHDPSLLVSPPMTAPSFSDMLKQTNGSLAAAALGFGNPLPSDFSLNTSESMGNQIQATMTATSALSLNTPRSKDDELMELANFTLEERFPRQEPERKPHVTLKQRPPLNPNAAQRPQPAALNSSNAAAVCSRIMDDDDDDDDDDDVERSDLRGKKSSSGASTPSSTSTTTTQFGIKRPFEMVEDCSMDSCATITNEDDRGFRKKSREKMRRQEVNVKFDELIDLLGLSNRVRKSAILQEAVSAIKTLKRERDEMRRDRDRLQQEVSKLATCLQYSHLGSVAAANAVAMSQASQNSAHFQQMNAQTAAAQLSQMNAHQLPGPGCFPIGSTTFGATLAPAGGGAAASSTINATPIAPKVIKPASELKS